MNKTPVYREFTKGLWSENPVFVQVLGICQTLAVTTTAINGISMGLATTFVLICSGVMVAIFRKIIPGEVRIVTFMAIIALFVTVAKYYMDAFFPDISAKLGPYVPLIVVNCIILGRAEAFASKNGVFRSLLDMFGNGFGFTLALIVIGSFREILGSGCFGVGTPFQVQVFGAKESLLGGGVSPMVVMLLPAGAFITFGLAIGLFRFLRSKQET